MLGLYLHLEFDSHLLLAHCTPKIGKGLSLPMDSIARRSPKRVVLPLLRICNKGSSRSNKTTWISRFELLTHCFHHSKHLCIKAFLLNRILLDPRNAGVPNGLSLATLASAAKRSRPTERKENDKKRVFFNKCTKSPDKIQQKCTCTNHIRAGTKVPSTSAHSLYAEWQTCSLTFAKHATL
jgi:hypothetical protein